MRDKAFSWLLLFLFGLCMEPALAGEDDAFSLRGFGTLGLARSSSDHAEYVRDLSQPLGIKGGQWSARIDSVLGLQANWQVTNDIRDMNADNSDRTLVSAIISMAASHGLNVVAEGVEDALQLALLEEMGCGFGQGYYFSRPVAASDFMETTRRIDAELL